MATMAKEPIDKRQLKTLLKTSLRTDWRSASTRFGGDRKSSLGIPPIVFVLIMYLVMSVMLGSVVDRAGNLFLGLFFALAMQMVFVSVTILLEFSHLILSPDDFPILAPHPVNSRTFFVAKLLHLIIYVTLIVASLGLVPSVIAAIVYKDILLFPLTFIATWACGLTTALCIALFYTVMLRIANRERMHRYLGYLQFLMTFVIYGGYMFLPELGVKILAISKSGFDFTFLYLLPPGWFASWPAMLSGPISTPQVWAAAAGVVSLAAFYFLGNSRLTFQYAETLSETVEQQESKAEIRQSSGILTRVLNSFACPEDRVVWQLMRRQFKYDNRYKMSLLVAIPLTLLYLYMGLKGGQVLADPFAPLEVLASIHSTSMVYFVLAIIPYMVVINTAYSASYQAAWIYYSSPADRTRLVLASHRFAIIFFCIPYLIFMGGLMVYFFGSVLHALLHSIVLLLLLLALVGALALISPRFPFSQGVKSGQRTGAMMISLFIPMLVVVVPMFILSRVGYGGVIGYGSVVFVLLLIVVAISALQKRIIPRRLANQECLEG
jgi:ABC-2 type transport system permease protein